MSLLKIEADPIIHIIVELFRFIKNDLQFDGLTQFHS